jgi:hypothetical protein
MVWEIFFVLLLVLGWTVGVRATSRTGLGMLLPFGAMLLLFVTAFGVLFHYWWRWAI